jgi:hypothetical protein
MEKVFVKVRCLCREDGDVEPLTLIWRDGRVWEISRVLHASRSPDGAYPGVRYAVLIGNAERYLYKDGSRWYVESS